MGLSVTLENILDKNTSQFAITILYIDGNHIRTEIGVPYYIEGEEIILGPYFKDISNPPPNDYNQSKRKINMQKILRYKVMSL